MESIASSASRSLSLEQADSSSSFVRGGLVDPKTMMQDWLFECHGFWHNALLFTSSVLFVLYLASQARKSLSKLSHDGRSHIMIAYYASLWLVSLLNLAWCCLQGNYTSGLEALTRTFLVSGMVIGLDLLLKAIYLFGFGIPLFIDKIEHPQRTKWGLWVVHRLVLTAVYGCILFMYHSRWRERLPARPAFYKYVIIMFIMNAVAVFACGLTGNGAGFGLWLYGATSVCYHAFYLPLLYITFLADFFQEDDLNLESVYYSEMKDAGFFDSEWE